MDEIWQRHKNFVVQVIVGAMAFLIALAVMSNAYSGADDPDELQRVNADKKRGLEKALAEKRAPSPDSIRAQKERAAQAEQQIRSMASQVASLAEGDEYVRENIVWTLSNFGRPASEADTFFNLYKQLPQTCVTRLREEARAALVARASQDRVEFDEALGFGAGLEDDEVPMALHGLALMSDVVRRVLETNLAFDGTGKKRIHAVRDLRVTPRNTLDRDLTWIAGLEVHVTLVGDPGPVLAVLRSFSHTDNPMKRMTVLGRLESITRPVADEDTVKASFTLLGLQHKGVKGAEK